MYSCINVDSIVRNFTKFIVATHVKLTVNEVRAKYIAEVKKISLKNSHQR